MLNIKVFNDFDIGVNLFCNEFKNPEEIYLQATQEKIGLILTGCDALDNEKAYAFCKEHNCFCTAGIHPHNAEQMSADILIRLAYLGKQKEVVAIGECGLDYYRLFNSKTKQQECFLAQLELADKLEKPLFLHCREAEEDFIQIFKRFPNLAKRSIIHCYTSKPSYTKIFQEMGFKFGITGWLCDERRNQDLIASLPYINLDNILVETDAPYLTPRGYKLPYVNKPTNLFYILETLAKYKGVDVAFLRQKCLANTLKFFNLY